MENFRIYDIEEIKGEEHNDGLYLSFNSDLELSEDNAVFINLILIENDCIMEVSKDNFDSFSLNAIGRESYSENYIVFVCSIDEAVDNSIVDFINTSPVRWREDIIFSFAWDRLIKTVKTHEMVQHVRELLTFIVKYACRNNGSQTGAILRACRAISEYDTCYDSHLSLLLEGSRGGLNIDKEEFPVLKDIADGVYNPIIPYDISHVKNYYISSNNRENWSNAVCTPNSQHLAQLIIENGLF